MKKLILLACFMISGTFLSAADYINSDSILAGVKELSEEQMQSITGEDIYYYYYYPSTNSYELYSVLEEDYAHGYILINMEDYTQSYDNIVTGPLEDLVGVHIEYAPPGYR